MENNRDFVDRMIYELKELESKLQKLRKFMETSTFKSLSLKEQGLLIDQEYHMTRYSEILHERINVSR